jgi:cysteine desulfurase/selenocysteine lyase
MSLTKEQVNKIRKEVLIPDNYIFLDNGASTPKLASAVKAMEEFYSKSYANIHRGVYKLSEEATELYENSRKKVGDFIGSQPEEVIFTKNTTESLNLLADSLVRMIIAKKGKASVLISLSEHHSNIVPWMIAKERYKNVEISFVGLDQDLRLDVSDFRKKVSDADIVSLAGASNVTGFITGHSFFEYAKSLGKITICDGAQLVPHHSFSLEHIDFLAFSGHKMLGPTGIGVLYGRKQMLEKMPCFLGGGEMVSEVSERGYKALEPPHKFEAGTMPFVEAYGLSKAVEFLSSIGLSNIEEYEHEILEYALKRLGDIKSLTLFAGCLDGKNAIVSFVHKKLHPHDISALLDRRKIATRAGTHCAIPMHKALGVTGTVRASFYLYNTFEEIDALADALREIEQKY